MKILYRQLCTPKAWTISHTLMEYMGDTLLHGLRSLYGANCIDFHKAVHLYTDFKRPLKQLYGKGFTTARLLPNIAIDRDDIDTKIRTGYFDLVILLPHTSLCGRHNKKRFLKQFNQVISVIKKPTKVVFVDVLDNFNFVYGDIYYQVDKYFKREMTIEQKENIYPISYSIPKEKIRGVSREKNKFLAHCVPHDKTTYTFNQEVDYYNDYAASFYGATCKKGGWDCMRHYEIIAAGTAPFFSDLSLCPANCMTSFPKDLVKKLTEMTGIKTSFKMGEKIDPTNYFFELADNFDYSQYYDYMDQLHDYALNNLTTEANAKRFIETCMEKNKIFSFEPPRKVPVCRRQNDSQLRERTG